MVWDPDKDHYSVRPCNGYQQTTKIMASKVDVEKHIEDSPLMKYAFFASLDEINGIFIPKN